MKSFFKKIIVLMLTWEARLVLARYRPKIAAITGSVGKTSAKDALAGAIAERCHVRKSEKSFNGELGIPLTILGLPNGWSNPFVWLKNIFVGLFLLVGTKNYPEWLVIEIGADHPGDIESLGRWLAPDAVIVTRLSEVPVHVEFFSSPGEIIKEKGFLVQALKDDGTLFLNSDDRDVLSLRDRKRQCRLVTFGLEEPADFQASNLEIAYRRDDYGINVPLGITFKINHGGNSVPIHLEGKLGRQHVYPALIALAFGESLGINNMIGMAENVKTYPVSPGRMSIIAGVKHTTIIDDTYNSSPVAVAEALRTLGEIRIETSSSTSNFAQDGRAALRRGRKIAVLGDMLELGKYSIKAHEKVGKEVVQVTDILLTVGLRARDIATGALDNGMAEENIFQFDETVEAGKYLESIMKEGDIVLVKGSQGARMERIVEEIMAHPEDKERLLVRQEKEWYKR